MKKIIKPAVMAALLLMTAGTLTGCGKKQIDVMEGVELEFYGVNGYGTAYIADEYTWEEETLGAAGLTDDDDAEAFRGVYTVESSVKYEVSPRENLSNGDVVTVTAKVDNEAVGGYKIEFTGKEREFTVEGLKEVEEVDLFKGVEEQFEGFAPYVKAVLRTQDAGNAVYVRYTLDRSENLAEGDTVVVTAEFDADSLLQQGYIAASDMKEFAVPECDRYVTELADIPSETADKMNRQFEDAFRAEVANSWRNKDALDSIEFLGAYLLTEKEGVGSGAKNAYYGVYRINVTVDGGSLSYYSYCQFKNLAILRDGEAYQPEVSGKHAEFNRHIHKWYMWHRNGPPADLMAEG
ncbi:MAG: hypothetical protein NC121_17725 [Blautia sp.]|nr:hypothetical protein [Blautia sp.]